MTDSPVERSPRILITRLSAHGDVVQALPLLSALKGRYPDCFIGWVVEGSAAPLLLGHPLIDRLHVSQRKRWIKECDFPGFLDFLQGLRQERYQISLDVQGLFKSALWAWLAGIPKRFGFAKARELADIFYTDKLPEMLIRSQTQSAVHKYLELAVAAGCEAKQAEIMQPRFVIPPVSPERNHKIQSILAVLPTGLPRIVLAPRTIWPTKHWETPHWEALSHQLAQLPVAQIAIGAPEDETLQWHPSVLELTGQTDLEDLYPLFQQTDLLIGLDSAPLHIANAVGHPRILGLYGPTAPGRTGPIGQQHHTLSESLACQPCFERHCPIKTHACMSGLLPNQVVAMVKTLLSLERSV